MRPRRLYGDGFVGVSNSARLELLLEHHRRIVESMPAEVDRHRHSIRSHRACSDQSKTAGADEGDRRQAERFDDQTRWKAGIAESLPALFHEAEQVAFYAHEFAQDKAVEHVGRLQSQSPATSSVLIDDYRNLRMQEAQEAIAFVSEAAQSLMLWVLLCVVAAGVLIGPIGLATMHNVLSRLRRITQAMVQASRKRYRRPSFRRSKDRDEVGEMARAVEVFKDNAIQLIAREVELKQLNRRIDIALNNMTHGLCMFDAEQKLIVCNKTYVQMYALPPELAQPGTLLQAIDNYRAMDRQQRACQSRADGGGHRRRRRRCRRRRSPRN